MTLRITLKSAFAAAMMLAAAGLTTQASADAVDDITKAGAINVGIFSDFPPFSSASADMSIKGYDIDVAQAIADSLKVKLNLVSVTGQNRRPH